MIDNHALQVVDEKQLMRQASQLIKAGQKEEAFRIVSRILNGNRDNTTALWWYARLATNRKSRIRALEHLLSLEPGHQKAEALLDKLDPIVDTTFDAPLYDPSPSYYDPEPSYYSASSGSESTQIERERLALERERLALERRRFQRQSDVNQAALAIGFIAAGFFGFFGVAHMVNGKIGEGIMRMIGGWVYLFIAGFVLGLTLFVAAIVIVPMHFVISYNDAKKGASYY